MGVSSSVVEFLVHMQGSSHAFRIVSCDCLHARLACSAYHVRALQFSPSNVHLAFSLEDYSLSSYQDDHDSEMEDASDDTSVGESSDNRVPH